MNWFYFVDANGRRHFASSRDDAEQKRKNAGGGSVITETSIPPSNKADARSKEVTNAGNSNFAQLAGIIPMKNDTSWLLRSGELVYGQNKFIPALQIYHAKLSRFHCDSDKRILRLKDAHEPEVAHFSAALKRVLPRTQTILLCCSPGSVPGSISGVAKIIGSICGGPLIDGSSILQTQTRRERKSQGSKVGALCTNECGHDRVPAGAWSC